MNDDHSQLVKRAHNNMRHGPDITRRVKTWHRLQAGFSMKGKGAIEDMLVEGAQRSSNWPAIAREVFGRLYSGDSLRDVDEPHPEHASAQKIHDALDELPEAARLMARCQAKAYDASAATHGLCSQLVEQMPEHMDDASAARRRRDLLAEDYQQIVDEFETSGQLGPPPPPPKALDTAQRDLDDAVAEAQQHADNIDPGAVRQAARRAIAEVNEHLDGVDRAMRACGWGSQDGDGNAETDAARKQALADHLENAERIDEIMRLAGRLKDTMREAQASRVKYGTDELTDIEVGANIDRLLPSELMLMKHPQGKYLLARKLFERGALQYRLEGKDKKDQGPVVICIDDSSSMNGARETWSKALALALLELARKKRRSWAYCLFGSKLTHTLVEPRSAGKTEPAVLLDALLKHRGGGTSFDPPLTWAFDQIESDGRLDDADVIFISDGECVSQRVKDQKRRAAKLGARVWGIALGSVAINNESEGSMRDFCERIYPITELRLDKPTDDQSKAERGVLGI